MAGASGGRLAQREQHDDVVAVVARGDADAARDPADLLVAAGGVEAVGAGAAAAGEADRLDALDEAPALDGLRDAVHGRRGRLLDVLPQPGVRLVRAALGLGNGGDLGSLLRSAARRAGPGRRPQRLHHHASQSHRANDAQALLFGAELVRHSTASWNSALTTAFIETFVPGGYDSGTGQIAIPVGQAALYLAIPLGLLFYVRHRIGPKTWRVLHRFVIVVYVLSVWHTLLYGTNVWYDGWFRTSVWLLQLPIAALLLLRLLRPARRSRSCPSRPGPATASRTGWALRLGGRLAVVGVMVALVVVVVSGNDGGRTVPPDDTASTHNHD
ncbi:hypothetical protein SMICM17S_06182 [Streptomyces microflavus]